jgi:CRP-like cAMP-binding protein
MSLGNDVQLLKQVALFDDLDTEQLQLLAFNAELRKFRAGDILFEEGAPALSAFVVVKGEVSLTRPGDISVGGPKYFGPGTIIGEMAMIANSSRPATARAETQSDVFVIPRQLFHRVLEEFPETAERLREKISARLRLVVGDLATVRPLFDDAM